MDEAVRPNYTVQMKTEYMCSFCGEMFTNLPEMQLHVSTHTRGMASSSSCNVCGKSYNTASKLRRHVRTHSGEKPYPCGICGRCFGRSDHLKQHMKVHFMASKRQKNLCRLCGMMFLKIETLLSHLSEHGVVSAHNCAYCGEMFGSAEKLELHEREHVKTQTGPVENVGELKLEAPDIAGDVQETLTRFPPGEGVAQDTTFPEIMLGVARRSAQGNNGTTDHNACSESSTKAVPLSLISMSNLQPRIAAFPRTFTHEFDVVSAQATANFDNQSELARNLSSCSPFHIFPATATGKPEGMVDGEVGFSSSSGQISVSSEQDAVPAADDADTGPEVRDAPEPKRHCRRKHRTPRKCEVRDLVSDEDQRDEVKLNDNCGLVPSEDGSIHVEGIGVGVGAGTFQPISCERGLLPRGCSEKAKEMSTLEPNRAFKPSTNDSRQSFDLCCQDSTGSEVDRLHCSTDCSSVDRSPMPSHHIAANAYRSSLLMHGSDFRSRMRASRLCLAKAPDTPGHCSPPRSPILPVGSWEAPASEPDAPGLQRTFRCEPCRTLFEDYSMYLLHNSLHVRGGQTPFACLRCGKRLGNRLEFTAHLVWHLSPNMDRL
ncbi:protein suppressor of hairy wing-like [Liolophura sinensis]|uniref:protein suppressor of hairy wing-like n=1 Tax=Liolophura sinensis TaxID=3198878 RepID=UPI003158E908